MSSKLWKGLLQTMQLELVRCVYLNSCASQHKDECASKDAENCNAGKLSQNFRHRSREYSSSMPNSIYCWVDCLNIISWTFNLWHINVLAVSDAHPCCQNHPPSSAFSLPKMEPSKPWRATPPLLGLDVTVGCSLDLVLWFLSNPVAVW